MHFQPRVDERPDQPCPDRALMISAIARTKVSAVDRLIIGMFRRKRTKPDRREQFALGDVDHRFPTRFIQHRVIERDREELVRPAGRIIRAAAVDIHHVIKMTTFLKPKSFVERLARTRRMFGVALSRLVVIRFPQPAFEKFERVEPKRIDLDRFPAARRHHPIAHLRVHPGELVAFLSSSGSTWILNFVPRRWCSAMSTSTGNKSRSVMWSFEFSR